MTLITNPHELCRQLELPESVAGDADIANTVYPLRVPEAFVRKIEKRNANDPLLLQILPRSQELEPVDGFSDDPLREHVSFYSWNRSQQDFSCQKCSHGVRVMQKYENRVLLLTTDECAVHCRYCFRRTMKNDPKNDGDCRFDSICEKTDVFPPVTEVVLSGGDPLCLADDELEELLCKITRIPSVKRIRIHTRFPVVEPNRWTQKLLNMLRSDRETVFSLVLHMNHPREIDADFETAVIEAVDRGIPIFSQSVLLRGVNDSEEVLFELYEKLISLRIHPYYLHQLDRVSGTAPFEVDMKKGRELMNILRRRLPGYAVPKYVQEIPGQKSKIEVNEYP